MTLQRTPGLQRPLQAAVLTFALVGTGLLGGCSDAPQATRGSTLEQGMAVPQLDPSQQSQAPSGAGALADQRPVTLAEIERTGYTWGSNDAPIHVVEFSDFGCGYCRQFHLETFAALMDEFVDSGKVHWRFVPFNVGMFPNAEGALSSGLCGGAQGKLLEMGDALFERQREWKTSGDVSGVFVDAARSAGLDLDAWNTCMEEEQLAAVSVLNTNMARRLGVRGTPTFFVDGYPIPGALPLETFREVFASILEESAATP